MRDCSDEDFFAALAGRPPATLRPAVRDQVQALRAAIAAHNRALDDGAADQAPELERLLFRLRREGLLQHKAPRRVVPLALAALLVLSVGIVVFGPAAWRGAADDAPVMRGPQSAVQSLETQDIEGTVAAIEAVLKKHAVTASLYPLGIYRGLSASVPPAQSAAVRAELQAFGLALPPDGELRVEVRSSSGSKNY